MRVDRYQRFLAEPMKIALLAGASCVVAAPAWTASESEQSPQTASAQSASSSESASSQESATLDQLAEQDSDLGTFVKAVKEAGLGDALTGSTYTIFAPTDEAFESADQSVQDLMKPENRQQLADLLRAHIVADDVDPDMANEIGEAKTLDGGIVKLSSKDGNLMVGDASVVKSNIQEGSLRVYAIDQVLSPDPSASLASGQDSTPQFEELDQDGNGYLADSELEGHQELASQRGQLDQNGDDRISQSEFAAFEPSQQGNGSDTVSTGSSSGDASGDAGQADQSSDQSSDQQP